MSDQIAEVLRRSILSGTFSPGEQLVEAEIAKRLGTSRNPVREALRKLEKDGLVVRQPYKGYTVVELTSRDVHDLYELRCALESLAVRRIASDPRPEVIALLRHAVEEIEQAAGQGDLWAVIEKELAFHELLCKLSGNKQLEEVYASISHRIRLILAFDNSGYSNLMDVATEHEPLVDVIATGDVERAQEMLRDHIMSSVPPLVQRLDVRPMAGGNK